MKELRITLAARRASRRCGSGLRAGGTAGPSSGVPRRRAGVVPIVTLALVLLGLPTPVLVAQTDEVPTDLQAALFEKIFRYVRTLDGPDETVVLVVFDEEGRRKARQIAEAFSELGVDAQPVEVELLREAVTESSVLYLLSTPAAEVTALCEELGLLSLSGSPATVEEGGAAVGVRLDDGRPQILVNMTKLTRDGHRISAELLKLAKVIQ